jgi:hypothetical protein
MATTADKIKAASKNKAAAAPAVAAEAAEKAPRAPKLDSEGNVIPPAPRKSNAELHVIYTEKLAKLEDDYATKKAKITKRLDELSQKVVPTNDLGKFLAEGKTEEDIEEQIKKLQKIRAAMKKHTPEELEAIRAAAEAEVDDYGDEPSRVAVDGDEESEDASDDEEGDDE